MTHRDLIDDACESFYSYVYELADDELRDMLLGDLGRRTGIPDLSRWSKYKQQHDEPYIDPEDADAKRDRVLFGK